MVSSLPSVNWVNVDNFDSIVENVSGKNKTKNGIFFVEISNGQQDWNGNQ